MLRTCDGTDPTIIDATGKTGSCGRMFDDVAHQVICPHDPKRNSRPVFPGDDALRAYTLVAGRAGDFYVQCEPCAFDLSDRGITRTSAVHWCQVRSMSDAMNWVRFHDGIAEHHLLPDTPPAPPAHHHHPLGVNPCTSRHADHPEDQRHAYAVLTPYGVSTYSAKVYADLEPASREAERTFGILTAFPILADWRDREPEPLPEVAPVDAHDVARLAAAGPAWHSADDMCGGPFEGTVHQHAFSREPAVDRDQTRAFTAPRETTDIREAMADDLRRMGLMDPEPEPEPEPEPPAADPPMKIGVTHTEKSFRQQYVASLPEGVKPTEEEFIRWMAHWFIDRAGGAQALREAIWSRPSATPADPREAIPGPPETAGAVMPLPGEMP